MSSPALTSRPRAISVLPTYRAPRALSSVPSTPSSRQGHRSYSLAPGRIDNRLQEKFNDNENRLEKAWADIVARFSKIASADEPDDVVDIRTGRIIVDKGHLRSLPSRDLEDSMGFDMGEEAEESDDEDELALNDEAEEEDTRIKSRPVRSIEDQEDIRAFLRDEEMRKSIVGDEDEEGDLLGPDDVSDGQQESVTSVEDMPEATLEDLFTDEEEIDSNSDDELLAETSEAEEASKMTLVSTSGSSSEEDNTVSTFML
jgi:hypothetical protein